MIIDSHCHVGLGWYEPLETLQFHMEHSGVDRAVLVQFWAELDNSYQEKIVAADPERFASVVMVDATADDAPATLATLVERGAAGVRLRPGTHSPGEDPKAIWRAAAELGTVVSCVGSPDAFASDWFADVLASFPSLTVVIEHLGEILPLHPDYDAEAADRIFALGRFPNARMKFSGFGEYSLRVRNPGGDFPFERPMPDLLDRAIAAFGPARLLWGSDFPPSSRREGYDNSLRLPQQELQQLSQDERDLMFGGNAHTLFFGGR